MKDYNILVPIGADDRDGNLMVSGIRITTRLKGKLGLLYIVEVPEYKGYPPSSVAISRLNTLRAEKERLHEDYLNTLGKFKGEISTDIEVEFISEEGTWLTGIRKAVISMNPDILLLRNEHNGLLDKILGESNTEVVHNVDCPVWIIPENYVLDELENIGFVLNHNSGDIMILNELIALCKSFDARLHLIHQINDDYDSRIRKSGFRVLMEEDFPGCEAFHHDLPAKDITEGISGLIAENKLDLLVVQNEDKNFLQRFFTGSSVDKLTESVEIPLALYK